MPKEQTTDGQTTTATGAPDQTTAQTTDQTTSQVTDQATDQVADQATDHATDQTADQTADGVDEVADAAQQLKAEDYKLPEGVPQEVAKMAEDLGFTQEQLDKSIETFSSYSTAQQQAEQKLIREEGETLVRSWGDAAKQNLALVRRALKVNDPTGELTEALNATGFGNHPAVLRYLLNVGKQLDEGGFIEGQPNTPDIKKTAAQVLFGKTHPSATDQQNT